ncbi:FAD/NAD(P)-binding domain-containing protein [Aspergillus taichungensis]|uniref:FAD/NAD(P)-binding domain-containing protein n=1 Tax=Aspergillus taichungensis TaxID=482145 RepID=A0A2J5HMC4_9EURO|nr:FAD/NAD(P)-binding domain-containing protein [Aspergillus taichungensis]
MTASVETPTPDSDPLHLKAHVERLLSVPNGTSAGPSGTTQHDPYAIPLNTEHAYTARKIRVITIGAGFSGLLLAHKIQHRFPELDSYVSHTIFEARGDVGGTWLVNTYPGVQCDVPAHAYAFPFDPNPNWSKFYASGTEIQDYIHRTVRKWNLDRDLQLNTRVVEMAWQAEKGEWRVEVENTLTGEKRFEYAEIVLSAQGVLVHPVWPKIPGFDVFKGHLTHSGDWDHDFDYSGKRIAVIGNGSSGIQITPQMANLPGTTVVNFMRSPAWVYLRVPPSRHHGNDDPNPNPPYTEEQIKAFQDPETHRQYRKGILGRTNKTFRLVCLLLNINNEEAQRFGTNQMAEKLNHDPELCEKLIPKFEVGCRRVTPGQGYLESFSLPNCNLSNSTITHISENAVHTADGKAFECDVVICATGFDVSHIPHFPIIGKDGRRLADKWNVDPETYLSVSTVGFPNYFIMMGPNCLGGHGSLVESLNWTGDYFMKWIRKIATEDIKSVEPKLDAEKAFVRYGDQVHKTLVWTGGCKSWYKRGTADGRVVALFGGSAILFRRMMQEIRGEDWDIEYSSANRFRFMGNGFTAWEMKEDSDLAWYVELPGMTHQLDTI